MADKWRNRMDDHQFITLDTNLPSLLEDVGYKIDWNDDEERNNYHAFRNRIWYLIDKYYGESKWKLKL